MTKEQAVAKTVKDLGYESFDDTWGNECLVRCEGNDNFYFSELTLRMFRLLVRANMQNES